MMQLTRARSEGNGVRCSNAIELDRFLRKGLGGASPWIRRARSGGSPSCLSPISLAEGRVCGIKSVPGKIQQPSFVKYSSWLMD